MSPPAITVGIPIFNEEPVLPELLGRLTAGLAGNPGVSRGDCFRALGANVKHKLF
jgi:hypothetical protein